MPGEDMEIISEQLNILELHHQLAKGDRETILKDLQDLKKKDPDTFKEYSSALAKGLPEVTKGMISAIKAGKSGDPYAISIAAIDVFAGVVTIAGPMLGPVGSLVSALAGMISSILGEFLPKPPSLLDEITKLLDRFLAEEKLRNLGTALDQIWVLSDTIQYHSLNYKALNLQHGPEVTAIDDAWQWLNEESKQSVPEWGQVLEKTCMVWVQLLRCVALSIAKPSTRKGAIKGEMLIYLPARQELFLKYLRSIKPIAQDRGLYLHIGINRLDNRYLYAAAGKKGSSIKWDSKNDCYYVQKFSIFIPEKERGAPKPRYRILMCTYRDLQVATIDAATTDVYGLTSRNNKASDICAVPAARHELADVYASPSWGGVQWYTLDDDNKLSEPQPWNPPAKAPVQSVRVVDVPETLADDPDKDGIDEANPERIYYAALEHSSEIWVATHFGIKYLPMSWDHQAGIEVDPYYLWAFLPGFIACITHASVMKYLQGKIDKPSWIEYTIPQSAPIKGLKSLCPCQDETIVASDNNNNLWNTTYAVNLKKRAIELKNWEQLGGAGHQIWKVPIPCWPIFADVMQDLEDQVKGGHSWHEQVKSLAS